MNKRSYTLRLCLLAALFSLSYLLTAQCPPALRVVSNCKSDTPNDAIGAVLKDFFTDGSTASWLFEAGATFTENGDGTANLTGVLSQYPLPSTRRFKVSVQFIGQTYTTPVGSPMLLNTSPSTVGWYYYEWGTATLIGIDDLDGAELNLYKRGKSAQIGIGGADQVPDINKLGMSAWFSWEIVSQPNNTNIVIKDFPDNFSIDQGDLCFTLSGEPTVCNPTGCIGDQTFCDNNNNGVFDAGDAPALNLTITLCDENYNLITTQAVDGDGKYKFTGLAAGTYHVKFPTATLDGKPLTTTSPIKVVLGEGEQFLDADAGYYKATPPPTGCIGDQTYCDNNNNGKFDAGDIPATNLTVTLCDANNKVIATQAVDNNGKYIFAGLVAGTYYVKFPSATSDGKPLSTPGTLKVDLSEGQKYLDADAGYYRPCITTFDPNKCYRFVNVQSGKVLDVSGASMSNNASVIQWTPHKGANQQWQIVPTTNGFVKIVSRNSGKVLASHHTPNGSKAYQYDFYTGGAKEWKIVCNEGCYRLIHRLSGRSLEIEGKSNNDGAKAQIWDWNGGNHQQWRIEEVPCATICKPKITFKNGCDVAVNIFQEINGVKHRKACLNLNQSWSCYTTNGSKWFVCDAKTGNLIVQYTVNGCSDQTVNITLRRPATCNLTFRNNCRVNVHIYWINSRGQRVRHTTLMRGSEWRCKTYTSHKWVVCNAITGAAIRYYTVNSQREQRCEIYDTRNALSPIVFSFEARAELNRARIEWATNQSYQVDYFTVQKWNDTEGVFKDLSIENNIDYTEDLKQYLNYDNAPTEGDNIYRVKTMYLDGTETISAEKKVNFRSKVGATIFPNPATDFVEVSLDQYEGLPVTLSIVNNFGQVIHNQSVERADKTPVRMAISHLPAGQYLVRIQAKGMRDLSKRFSVQ